MADKSKATDISGVTKAATEALDVVAAAPKAGPSDIWAGGSERLRATTRWVLAVFGAVGVSFLAGLPFAGLNELVWPSFAAAVTVSAAVIIATGLLLTLRAGSEVFISRLGTLTDLQSLWQSKGKTEGNSPFRLNYPRYELFRGMASCPVGLAEEWERARHEMWRLKMSAALASTSDGKSRTESVLSKAAEHASQRYKEINETTDYVGGFTAYSELVGVYRWAQKWIFLGGVLVVIGAFAFFCAVGVSDRSPDDSNNSSSTATVAASASPLIECPEQPGQAVLKPGNTGGSVSIRSGDTCQVLTFGVNQKAEPVQESTRQKSSPWLWTMLIIPLIATVFMILAYCWQNRELKCEPIRDDVFEWIREARNARGCPRPGSGPMGATESEARGHSAGHRWRLTRWASGACRREAAQKRRS